MGAATRWGAIALLAGITYLAFSLVFGELAARAGSHEAVVAWRLAAWILSAIVFAAHLWREVRATGSVHHAAVRAACGAALGAFGLAVAAVIHATTTPTPDETMNRLWAALAAFPLLTLVPAYLAGLVASFIMKRVG